MDNVAKGDLDYKVDIKSKDEIGQLTSAFNQMAKDLKESRMKIANYSIVGDLNQVIPMMIKTYKEKDLL